MQKSLTKLLITFIVIAVLLLVSFFGFNVGNLSIPSAFDKDRGIRQGLDLTGGSVITFEADAQNVSVEEMDTVENMMRKRLDSLGFTEATISKQSANRIRIEIPNINDPEEAMQLLGKTAKLTFVDYEGNVLVEGKDVQDAKAQYGQVRSGVGSENYIELSFTSEGKTKFAEATDRISQLPDGNNYIAIMMDDEVVSAPSVSERIDSDSAVIHGSFSAQSSSYLAGIIRAGQLPFSLTDVELRSIGPTLGERALESSLMAGGIGLLVVIAFMIIFYRLPGFMAGIALCAYTAILILAMTAMRVNLSLPGIAGIILSIGMAVDANVIVFERLKEELRIGKTVGTAVNAAFSRALPAIIDGNITTLIVAVVLGYFGTGPIKGFAITLGMGIVVSMFTAIFVTRFLLKQMVALNIRRPSLYTRSANRNV